VGAVFSDRRPSVDVKVFCDEGRPTVVEMERRRVLDED